MKRSPMETMGMIGVENCNSQDASNQENGTCWGCLSTLLSLSLALKCFENLSLAMVQGFDLCIFVYMKSNGLGKRRKTKQMTLSVFMFQNVLLRRKSKDINKLSRKG